MVGVAPPGFTGLFGESVDGWAPAHSIGFLKFGLPTDPGLSSSGLWAEIATFYGIATSRANSSTALASFLAQTLPLRKPGKAPLHASAGLTADPLRNEQLGKQLRLGLLLALVFTLLSSLDYALLLVARLPHLLGEVRLKRALGATNCRVAVDLIAGPTLMVGCGLILGCMLTFSVMAQLAHRSGFLGQLGRAAWGSIPKIIGIEVLVAILLTAIISLLPTLSLLSDRSMPNATVPANIGRRSQILLNLPVVVQIALCALTWVLAGMVAASFLHAVSLPLGWMVLDLSPGENELEVAVSITDPTRYSFPSSPSIRMLLSYVRALPGVEAAALSGDAPLEEQAMGTFAVMPKASTALLSAPRTVSDSDITPGFFRAAGTRILRGRDISFAGMAAGKEVIVNQSLARELWNPQVDPVGQRLHLLYPSSAGMPASGETATVVGVAEDMRMQGATSSPIPTVFRSAYGFQFILFHSYLLLHTRQTSTRALEQAIEPQVHALIPKLAITGSWNLRDRGHAALLPERRRMLFALGGALLMALISGMGLSGTLSYWVASRRREIAVRIALGASPASVRKLVFARAAQTAFVATVLSMPGWLVLHRIAVSGALGTLDWSTGRASAIALLCFMFCIALASLPAASTASIVPAAVLKEQ